METIKLINNAITIIDNSLAPNHIIIIGPNATLGRELIIVKNGSIIFANIGNSYIKIAITKLMAIPKPKAIVAIIILGYLLKWIFVDRKKTKINLGVKK